MWLSLVDLGESSPVSSAAAVDALQGSEAAPAIAKVSKSEWAFTFQYLILTLPDTLETYESIKSLLNKIFIKHLDTIKSTGCRVNEGYHLLIFIDLDLILVERTPTEKAHEGGLFFPRPKELHYCCTISAVNAAFTTIHCCYVDMPTQLLLVALHYF